MQFYRSFSARLPTGENGRGINADAQWKSHAAALPAFFSLSRVIPTLPFARDAPIFGPNAISGGYAS